MTTLEETLSMAKERYPSSVRWIGSLSDEQKKLLTAHYSVRILGRHMDGSLLYSMKYRHTDLPDHVSVSE
ncbi:MAG: hypothetical protein K6F23_02265 [Solobacterium sp.]|nr:hypothetical protein [Solobacterium sp.]